MPNVRARDLRDNVRVYGYEKGVMVTLEALFDERVQEREQMRELVDLVAMCVDRFEDLMQISTRMKDRLEELRRKEQQDDGTQSS